MYSKLNVDEVEPIPAEGIAGRVKNVGYTLQPNTMRPNLWELDAGETMVLHRQIEQEELYFVLDGRGEMQVDDEVFEISAGDIIVVQPDAWRQFTAQDTLEIFIVGAPNVKGDGIVAEDVPDDKLDG